MAGKIGLDKPYSRAYAEEQPDGTFSIVKEGHVIKRGLTRQEAMKYLAEHRNGNK